MRTIVPRGSGADGIFHRERGVALLGRQAKLLYQRHHTESRGFDRCTALERFAGKRAQGNRCRTAVHTVTAFGNSTFGHKPQLKFDLPSVASGTSAASQHPFIAGSKSTDIVWCTEMRPHRIAVLRKRI